MPGLGQDEVMMNVNKHGGGNLTAEQVQFVKDNPGGLTKEGCEEEIRNWNRSSNRHMKLVYETMLKSCKNFATSGKTADGKLIFARDAVSRPRWVGKPQN